jgi:hypothetical protein
MKRDAHIEQDPSDGVKQVPESAIPVYFHYIT